MKISKWGGPESPFLPLLTQDSKTITKLPEYVILAKDLDENIYAYYSKEPPYDFEIEYFMLKADFRSMIKKSDTSRMRVEQSDTLNLFENQLVSTGVDSVIRLAPAETHTLNLKLLEEVDQIAKNITPKVKEIQSGAVKLTPEIKKKLT